MTAPASSLGLGPMVGALRPIGLDELVERASLLTRLDRKYVLPVRELPCS